MSAVPRTARTLVVLLVMAVLVTVAMTAAEATASVESQMVKGHVALDRSEYRSAAAAFERAATLSKGASGYVEARYWYAFALHRAGSKRDLRSAAASLVELQNLEMDSGLYAEALDLAVRVKSDLAKQGDAKAAQELAEMVAKQEDLKLKLTALQGMMNVNPDKAYSALEQILRSREPGTAELRQQAVYLLHRVDTERSVDLLAELARNDPDPEVRQQAVVSLSQIGSEKAVDVLIEMITRDEDAEVKIQAIYALTHVGGDRAAQALRVVAADPQQPRESRELAIFWLGHEGGEEHLAYLRRLYAELTDPELKLQLVHGVANSESQAVADWLAEIVLDPDEDIEVRNMALHWVGQRGHLPLAQLEQLYRDVPEPEMHAQIIHVLAQDGSPEALQQLMVIAREEQDIELRQMAVLWIGQIGGEEAEQFLMEILER
jgi:HEAT repeat protein